MNTPDSRHSRSWPDEELAGRIMDLAGPDVAVICIRRLAADGGQGPDLTVCRATAWSTGRRPIPLNAAVSQLVVQLIRDRYLGTDWSGEWDYHVGPRKLLAARDPSGSGPPAP